MSTWGLFWEGNYLIGQNGLLAEFNPNPTEQTTAKIPVYIIPIKTVYGDISYSNLTLLATGQSALQSAFDSPVFKPYPFTLIKGNEFGKRQYLDAVEQA